MTQEFTDFGLGNKQFPDPDPDVFIAFKSNSVSHSLNSMAFSKFGHILFYL